MKYTFKTKYAARTISGAIVTIPDQVASAQVAFDISGISFTVLRRDGSKAKAILAGDEYGLHSTGTGDPVVRII